MNVKDYLIERDDTMLLVIDIQEKLLKAIPEKPAALLIKNTKIMLEAAALYSIPVIVTEQYRKGLGQTEGELMKYVDEKGILEKMFFNGMLEDSIRERINLHSKKNIIITGIETHVCVFQTVISLLGAGKNVIVISDAVASRRKHDWEKALAEMARAGARVYPAETAAFILLEMAGTPEFKSLSPLFK